MGHFMVVWVTLGLIFLRSGLADDAKIRVDKMLDEALGLASTSPEKGVELASAAIQLMPGYARGFFCRGQIYEALRKYPEALEDLNSTIKIDPNWPDAYDLRGSIQFKQGNVKESAIDFDQSIKKNPSRANGHWQRGISLYYANRFEEGKKQFEGYEKVDTNDVENAIWHFLCNARLVGIPRAQKEMLKIGKDRRIPMMSIYELYRGNKKPKDVLDEANQGGSNRSQQLFYAHLYLGIFAELEGNSEKAMENLELAANQYRIQHYMGDVARVHLELLKKGKKKDIKP